MKKIFSAVILTGALTLVGCATTPQYGDVYHNQNVRQYGVVERVTTVDVGVRDYRGPGFGAVAGAVVGGLLGNQVGSGSGRALATGAGAIAGGVAGDRIEQNTSGSRMAQEIVVRLDNGNRITVLQPGTSLYHGARVYVDGHGNNTRVIAY